MIIRHAVGVIRRVLEKGPTTASSRPEVNPVVLRQPGEQPLTGNPLDGFPVDLLSPRPPYIKAASPAGVVTQLVW